MVRKKFLVSIDVEEDISTYLSNSYKGIERGLPKLLELFQDYKIKADFFILGSVCEKYPKLIQRIADEGHNIGCHGFYHDVLYFKSYRKQLREITKATEVIEKLIGERPKMYRAVKFSVTPKTIRVLEELGYKIDSSVLPNAVAKRFKGKITIRSFEGAPTTPYHPSYKDVIKEGDSAILEVPLTENPIFKGAPIGMGALNAFGLKRICEAIDSIEQEYIIFLIHPWEVVDMGKYYPNLKEWVRDICSSNLSPLQELLRYVKKRYAFSTIREIEAETHGTS